MAKDGWGMAKGGSRVPSGRAPGDPGLECGRGFLTGLPYPALDSSITPTVFKTVSPPGQGPQKQWQTLWPLSSVTWVQISVPHPPG